VINPQPILDDKAKQDELTFAPSTYRRKQDDMLDQMNIKLRQLRKTLVLT
jgi:hypothetical protein